MAIDKVTAGVLADNAVTTTKVADNAVTGAKIADDTTLPGSFVKLPSITTTQRNALTAAVGMMIYNSTTGLAETYTALGWKSVDAPPTIASISPTTQAGTTADVVVTGTRFVTGFVAKFIGNDGTTYAPASTVFTSATSVTLRTPSTGLPASKEPFDIQITNPNGMTAVLHDVLDVGGEPSWTTASGSLGTLCDAARKFPQDLTAMAATDPQSRTITYSIQDGALPAGLSINSGTAALTGAAAATSADTTYNFTVRASTSDGDFTDRAFSIAISAPKDPVYFECTSADQDWTAPAGVTRVRVSAWGASGGNDSSSGFGGAGAYVEGTVSITAGAAYKIVVGRGGRRSGTDTEEKGVYGGGGNGHENPGGGGLSGFFDGNGAVFEGSASGTAYEANYHPVAAAWISGTDSRPNASWDRNRIIAGGGGGGDGGDSGGNGGGGAVGGATTSLSGGGGERSGGSGGVGGRADGALQTGQNASVQGGGHLKGADGQKAYGNIGGNPRLLGGGGGGYMGGMPYLNGADAAGGGGSSYTHPTLVTDVTTEGANSVADGSSKGGSHSGSSGLVYGASDIDRYNRIGGDIATNYTAGQVSTTTSGSHGIHGRLVLNF